MLRVRDAMLMWIAVGEAEKMYNPDFWLLKPSQSLCRASIEASNPGASTEASHLELPQSLTGNHFCRWAMTEKKNNYFTR